MEAIDAVVVVASVAVGAPFVIGFLTRSMQTIFSRGSEETSTTPSGK